MFTEFEACDNGVAYENLKNLSSRQSILCEMRALELREMAMAAAKLAKEMYDEGYGIYEILGMIADHLASSQPEIHGDCMVEHLSLIRSYLSSSGAVDGAVFASCFLDCLKSFGISVSEVDFLSTGRLSGRIAYLKNALSDEAFDVFSQDFEDPRVYYVSSFKEACAAVRDGVCEYCILPFEEKGGARLGSISSLIYHDDLKINSVTPVFGPDNSADVKYALLSKQFTVPNIQEGDDRYLEVLFEESDGKELSGILSAAGALSVSIFRINSISFETEDGTNPFVSIVFKSGASDFSVLLIYLTLYYGSYTAVGIYKNLE